MKLKLLFISCAILLTTFLIYLTTLDKKIYFLALGDSLANGNTIYDIKDDNYNTFVKNYLKNKNILEKYNDSFIQTDYRTTDLINDINDNIKIDIKDKKQTIKNALIKADLITLSIGKNDLFYKINALELNDEELYIHIDEILDDLDTLFSLLREYCKEDIIFLNFYRPINLVENNTFDKHFIYINDNLEQLTNKYNIHLVDINHILEKNKNLFDDSKKLAPNRNGHLEISQKIIQLLEKYTLN